MTFVRKSLVLLVISGVLGLSACGGDGDEGETTAAGTTATEATTTTTTEEAPTLATAPVEAALKKTLDGTELLGAPATIYPTGGGTPEQTEIGGGTLQITSVDCPADVPLEKGGTFTCQVDAQKGGGTAQVTQLDADGKKLKYRASLETTTGGISSKTKVSGPLSLD